MSFPFIAPSLRRSGFLRAGDECGEMGRTDRRLELRHLEEARVAGIDEDVAFVVHREGRRGSNNAGPGVVLPEDLSPDPRYTR